MKAGISGAEAEEEALRHAVHVRGEEGLLRFEDFWGGEGEEEVLRNRLSFLVHSTEIVQENSLSLSLDISTVLPFFANENAMRPQAIVNKR